MPQVARINAPLFHVAADMQLYLVSALLTVRRIQSNGLIDRVHSCRLETLSRNGLRHRHQRRMIKTPSYACLHYLRSAGSLGSIFNFETYGDV